MAGIPRKTPLKKKVNKSKVAKKEVKLIEKVVEKGVKKIVKKPVKKEKAEKPVKKPIKKVVIDGTFNVAQLVCPGSKIRYRKRFKPERMPSFAVVCELIAGGWHVLRWSTNIKMCNSDVAKITKKFIANKRRFLSVHIVKCVDLGAQTSEIDSKYVENRAWMRELRAKWRAAALIRDDDPERAKKSLQYI